MRVLLVRHGEAVDTCLGASDHDRWLTVVGREHVTEIGKELTRRGLRYSRIYTSPLVRAVQTADILAATQPDFYGPLEVHPALASDVGSSAQALAPLGRAGDEDLIVMVTHMPKIGALAAHLSETPGVRSFRTASACLLRVEDGRGHFEWTLDPETLKRELGQR